MEKQPVWLRGPVEGVQPILQPVAMALLQAVEDAEEALSMIDEKDLWTSDGSASFGYHLKHVAGSTDRLFTYARGQQMSDEQKKTLKAEKISEGAAPDLLQNFKSVVQSAIAELKTIPADTLSLPREVGREKLPSTVVGLLFHAAEHAARHAGQMTTTGKLFQNKQL